MPRMPANRKETVVVPRDNPSTASSLNLKFLNVIEGRQIQIDKVEYINPTGLAANAANFYVVALKKNNVVVASWSTSTTGQGALPANTFKTLVMSTNAPDLFGTAGDVFSFDIALTGTATLPAGTLVIHARYTV